MGPKPRPLADRFWEKVDKTGGPDACWLWMAAINKDGYGMFGVSRCVMKYAHRVAWALTHGSPSDHVLHSCDNPPCVNPAHLHEGDEALNKAEMVARGRSLTGERNPQAKLTGASVSEIRSRLKAGEKARALAAEYEIAESTISNIRHGRIWRAA